MSNRRKAWGALVGVIGVALLIGNLALGSNMGFKFVTNIPPNVNYNLSLPWNNNYSNAADILNDFSGVPNDPTIVTSVSQFQESGTLLTWVYAGNPLQNFTIAKGEAVLVQTGSSGAQELVVGSHDPDHVLNIPPSTFATEGGADLKNFFISTPYHGVPATCADLLNDICGIPNNDCQIVRNLSVFKDDDSILVTWVYAGPPPPAPNNCNLGIGDAVIAQTGTEGLSNYAYPHY